MRDANNANKTEEKETGRIEAFSDGVFAVAITLLVLDIKVPPLPASDPHFSLTRALLQEWPAYFAFITSFLTILVMWINHHRVFSLIKRSDDVFMLLNGLLLMCVTVIPFATSLVAAYIRHPDARIAIMLYAATNLAMAITFNRLWFHASHNNRLLAVNHDARLAAGLSKSYRFGPLIYLIVLVVACFSVPLSVFMFAALAIFFAIPPRKPNS
jgi:uncharacterized membrane protein